MHVVEDESTSIACLVGMNRLLSFPSVIVLLSSCGSSTLELCKHARFGRCIDVKSDVSLESPGSSNVHLLFLTESDWFEELNKLFA